MVHYSSVWYFLYQVLKETYRGLLDRAYGLSVQTLLASRLENEYQVERITMLLKASLKDMSIKFELWRFLYDRVQASE